MSTEDKLRYYLKRVSTDLDAAQERVRELEAGAAEPIAVIGMACRFPGGVRTPEQLWELVAGGVDAMTGFPTDRGWDLDAVFGPGQDYLLEGGFIDGATEFDAGFFGISPREALAMDPQQRLLLETSWEAFERAGIDPESARGSRTGVFVGTNGQDYMGVAVGSPDDLAGYVATGNAASVVSGRVSYVLGLEGPSLTVDTACSSSSVAVHLGMKALRGGECTLALAGGATIMSTPGMFGGYSQKQGVLAGDGRCKAFAESADGTGFGEGVGVLLLERLSDARANGHPVLALLRGSAVNSDGASNGLSAPNGPAQRRVIHQALADARLSTSHVDMVEAHGTGTTLGDPIEAHALLGTYGRGRTADQPLWLGSVKSNVGHTQAAAGVAGVIKVVMALRHGVLPPTLHVDQPSSRIDWDSGAVALLTQARPWPALDRPRRAAVSSFGISGTNAHLVLEQAPAGPDPAPDTVAGPVPVVLSARSDAALRAQAARLRDRLVATPERPADVAWSLRTGRTSHPHRAAVVAADTDRLVAGLGAVAGGRPGPGVVTGVADAGGGSTRPVFVFPGQGGQWAGMAAALWDSSEVFRAEVSACADAVAPHVDWSLVDVVRGVGGPPLERLDVVQPALFAVMAGLAALWRSVGVEPGAVVGTSQGEIAAAYVSGALSLEDAALVVARRSRLLADRLVGRGALASVALPVAEVQEVIAGLGGRLAVAGVSAPRLVTVAGPDDALAELVAWCAERDVRCRPIAATVPTHCPLVDDLRAELLGVLEPVRPRDAAVALVSTVTGDVLGPPGTDAGYWFANTREPVLFEQAMNVLMDRGHRVFVEMSPHPVMGLAAEQVIESRGVDAVVVGSLRRGDGGLDRFLSSVASAHVRGVEVDWDPVSPAARRVDLPTYPFQGTRFWPTSPDMTAHGPAGAPVDAAFWAAVEHADLAALATTMDLDETGRASLGEFLPLMSGWHQRRTAASTVDSWRYRIGWTPVDPGDPPVPSGTWLVVVPAAATEDPLVGSVRRALDGAVLVEVEDPDRATLADRLTTAAGDAPVAGVLSLLALDPRPSAAAAPLALTGSITLVQAVGDARIGGRLWLLTSGAVAATPHDTVTHPDRAALWGLGQVVALEQPHLWGGLIDLPGALDARAAARLRAALAGDHHEDQLALRAHGALGRRIVRHPGTRVGPGEPGRGWRPRGTVLVTGATGALGVHTARWLAEHGAEHLLMLSRSGPDAPGAAALEAELRERGVTVTLAACDVSDRDALAARIAALPPDLPLTAVVHTAAVLDDGVLDAQTPERAERVFGPKVAAARHLHELTAGLDLDAFVLFSSMAGTIGNGGQATYAAANAQLDALAAHRRGAGLPATSIAWGAVAAGMVAEPAMADRMRRGGTPPMPPEQATAAMRLAVDGADPVALIADVAWDTFAAGRLTGRGLALIGDLPEVRPVLEAAAAGPVPGGDALRDRLAALPSDEARRQLLELVRDTAAAVLGHASAEDVRPDQAFRELGFDSLTAVELRNLLGAGTGVALAATAVFDYPTPVALADHLATGLSLDPAAEVIGPAAARSTGDEPIAIVGMSCRFPGGVRSPEHLWELLTAEVDAMSGLPADRGWDVERLVPATLRGPDGGAPWQGGFLDAVADFDAAFFTISPREALAMDPQQRLLLEAAQEAFERAGLDPVALRGSRTGVFAGTNRTDYADLLVGAAENVQGYVGTGNAASVVSGRVAYAFGLEGPAVSVDTACSSSLVALHLAVQSLRAGECELALAGGVSVMCTPGVFVEYGERGVQAADGRCKAFAEGADGTGWAEGVGVVVVERLSDALRHGHEVLAVVRGSAVNSDGASNGLSAPNGPAQQRVIRASLANAGLDPSDVDAVEAHGTGTRLGDPIEAQALIAAYGQGRERPLRIGSVKSNLGHTQAAAGIAGVIKTVLALRHGELPRTLHVGRPTSQVDWTAGAVEVLTERVAWPETGRPRRAGVSSFGISGTNVHTILEQAPAAAPDPDPDRARAPRILPALPWVVSGRTPEALREQAARLRAHLLATPAEPLDVAAALLTTRQAFEHRAAVTASDRAAALRALAALASGSSDPDLVVDRVGAGRLAVLFPGQGAQRPGMGRELYDASPVFADAFDEVCAQLDQHLEVPVRDAIDSDRLHRTGCAQSALFAVEVALYRLLTACGVAPSHLAGHSVGELAAAHVAGVWSLADAARLVAARGTLMDALPAGGAMVSVRAAEADVAPLLTDGVSIAAVNGPASVVLSGDEDAVLAVAARFGTTKRLRVSHAFHSPRMAPMLDGFRAVAESLTYHPPVVPVVSTRTGRVLGAAELADPEHWVRHVVEPVRFLDAVRHLHDAGARTFLEVGPGGALSGTAQDCLTDDEAARAAFVPTLQAHRGEAVALAGALGRLHVRGIELDRPAVLAGTDARRVPLPTYAFQRATFWPRSIDPPPAPAPAAATDDTPFWTGAVDHADRFALGAGYELDVDAPLRDALPVLAAWRRDRQEQATVDSWSYGVRWQPVPTGDAVPSGRWLVVLPATRVDDPLVEQLLSGLATRGVDPIRFATDGDGLDRDRLVAELDTAVGGQHVAGVLSLLALDEDPVPGAASVPVGVAATVTLLQALGRVDAGPLWVLTRGAVATRAGEQANPAQGAVWGVGQVAAQELPGRWGGLVDLPTEAGDRDLDRLCAVLAGGGVEDQLAVRPTGLHARRLARVAPGGPAGPGWTPRGSVLVTGGTGALGGHVARWLVEHGARHLVLTSRRGPDAPGATELAASIEAMGATVTIAACDVADRAALAGLIAGVPAEHPLTAVVHTAAILDDGVLDSLTVDRLQPVMRPKVEGTVALHELTAHLELDAFVLFSSLAGTFGNPGQANYAAANAFMDAFAARRRALGLPATSIAWGGWADVGMATGEVVAERMVRAGIPPMRPVTAMTALGQAVDRGAAAAVVADVDWARFAPAYAMARPRPLIGDVPEVAALVAAASRAGAPTGPTPDAPADLTATLATVSPVERDRLLLGLVRGEVAAVLGHASGDEVDPDRAFSELGFDSVMSVELAGRIGAATGLRLDSTLVFDEPSPAVLRDRLRRELSPAEPAGGSEDDDRLRAAITAVPLDRIRAAGLLDALLALADPDPVDGAAEPEPASAISSMGVDDLIRMAMASTTTPARNGRES